MKFRKKPIVVDAERWWKDGDNPSVIRHPNTDRRLVHPDCRQLWDAHGQVDTREGVGNVCPGDWIITGVHGEKYPCKPDIFEATYEPIEEK